MREWMIGRCWWLVAAGRLAAATLLVFAVAPVPAMSLPAHQLFAGDPSQVGQWGPLMNWPLDAVHASRLPTGQLLLWDAWEYDGTPSAQLWDPGTGAFTPVANQSSQIFCSAHVQLNDRRLLVVGGHNGAFTGVNDVNAFDHSTSTWSLLPAMSYARWYPAVAKLGDGRVVAIAREITDITNATTPEVYNPPTSTWTGSPRSTPRSTTPSTRGLPAARRPGLRARLRERPAPVSRRRRGHVDRRPDQPPAVRLDDHVPAGQDPRFRRRPELWLRYPIG